MNEASLPDAHSPLGPLLDRDGFSRRCIRVLPRALVCVLIWLTHTVLPSWVGEGGLEPSWTTGLGYAFSRGWQAGVDYVFTFGPWGYFSTNVYVSDLYWIKLLVWEGAFKLCLAVVMTLLVFRIRGVLTRMLFVLVLVLPTDPDAYTFVSILGIAAWVLGSESERVRVAWAGLALLAVFPLVKFSYAAPAAACALAIICSHGRSVSWKARGALALGFAAMSAAAWVSAGQSLLNVPIYIQRSLQLASGYSEGMSSPAPPGAYAIAFALAGVLIFLAVLCAFAPPRSFPRSAWTCVCVPVLWVVYKSGFVRAADHTPIFFGFTMVAPFLYFADSALARPWKAAALASRLACVALSLLGLATEWKWSSSDFLDVLGGASQSALANARAFLEPIALRKSYEAELESGRARHALPYTRAAVGSSTIDMLSYHQGLLFLNDLNWRPRPVFQSYATFTPQLMELNAQFFRGERAAEFILFNMLPIDGRLPASDDALALQVIARDYEPVLIERTCLLLRRAQRRGAAQAPRVVVVDQELAFGETLDLSELKGACHLLRLDIRYTPWGRIRTFLDQGPPFYLEIDSDTGEMLRHRIVPGMLKAEVILDPLLWNRLDWKNWYVGEKMQRPRALRIPWPASPYLYEDSVHVTVLRADDVAPLPRPEMHDVLEASVLGAPVREVRAAKRLRRALVGSRVAVLLAPPSEILYDIAPGQHVLRFGFGFVRRAWVSAQTDGANFSVTLRQAGASDRVLFQRFLDPVRNPEDRRPQTAELRLQLDAPASLILSTDPGPEGDATGDLTAWTHVLLE